MEFDEMWHGLTKTVQFQAADMSTPISVTLTANLLEDGSTDTYLVPIPAGAKARHGIMRLAVKGAALNGDIETNAVLAVYGSFTVKESNWSSDAEEAQDVTPTQAEQLQSEIDVLLDEIAAITGHTEDAEAWAVGEREGAPVGPGDETYDNNAKHYAAAAAEKADAVLDMTVSAEGLPEGTNPAVEKTTSGGVFNLNFKIPHGLRGYRIGSVYKKSGTGAPGTTDVYGMKLNDPGQTEVGTFSVYNGANGEGSGDFMADGSVPMTGNLNANGHNVVGVSTPTANTDAANKQYVDDETKKRYKKPSGGIPKTDLASGVQTSLNAADNAVAYTAQTGKTDAQKQTARDNIDADAVTDRINNDTMLAMDGYISPVLQNAKNYKAENQYHKKVGRINLGSLNWTYSSVGLYFLASNLSPNAATWWGTSSAPNVFCNIYGNNEKWTNISASTSAHDKKCGAYANQVKISDSSYTDAAAFKAAMQGVYLYYELATEEVRNIDGTEIGDSLGKLGNAIVQNGWNQLATIKSYAWSAGAAENKTFGGNVNFVSGHIWLFLAYQANTMTSIVRNTFSYRAGGTTRYQNPSENYHLAAGWHTWRVTIPETGSGYFGFWVNTPSGSYQLDNVQGFDLTDIFGAGNEPSIEQFRQLFPDDYYPFATPGFGDLLWENAAPTSAFAAQTISVNLADFRKVMILCKSAKDSAAQSLYLIGDVGGVVQGLMMYYNTKLVRRNFTVSTSGITASAGQRQDSYATATEDADMVIPVKIYGIR